MRYQPYEHLALDAMALQFPALEGRDHPNRWPFQGILCRLDEPSTKAPHGSRGHRVLLPAVVAERALPSLLGMAVNLHANAEDHAPTSKVGLITHAEIQGHDLQVSGFLYAKDFPRETAFLRANRATLGMSYEMSQVAITDPDAEVWEIADFVFTGAAILQRRSAAYAQTAFAATATATLPPAKKDAIMALSTLRETLLRLQSQVESLGGTEDVAASADTPDVMEALTQLTSVVATLAAQSRPRPAPVRQLPAPKPLAARLLPLDDDDALDTLEEDIRRARETRLSAAAKAQQQTLDDLKTAVGQLTEVVTGVTGQLTALYAQVETLVQRSTPPPVGEAEAEEDVPVDPPTRKVQASGQTPRWASPFATDAHPAAAQEVEQVLRSIGVMEHQQRRAFAQELAAGSAEQAPDITQALDTAGITNTAHRMAIKQHFLASSQHGA